MKCLHKKSKQLLISVLIFYVLFYGEHLFAGGMAFLIGPPGVGMGGTNPVSIPFSFGDMKYTQITD